MASSSGFWSRIVTLTAFAGWLPFLAGLALTLYPPFLPITQTVFERAMLGYGVLILGFLGGVRWGIRLQGGAGSDLTYVVGIIGSVLGFFVLLMPYEFGLAVLTVAFGAQGAWDVWSGLQGGVPQSYARLRSLMTWLVCLTLIAILAARAVTP
ncbi:MAG TPA: DUF3429 domain-containing protein [Devosiaceae bacterium]